MQHETTGSDQDRGKPPAGGASSLAMPPALRAFVEEAPLERATIVEFVATVASALPPGSKVLDVGAGEAPYRSLFDHVEYRTLDHPGSLHAPSEGHDIVASGTEIPLADGSLDAVLSTQVLEHVAEPQRVLREMWRVLRRGGSLYATVPLAWEEHEMPHDYFRYTRSGMTHLLAEAGFVNVEIRARTDCFTTLAQLLRNARWSVGTTSGPDRAEAAAAFTRLEELADEVLSLAPLDSRGSFPLGYCVTAVKDPVAKRGRPAADTHPDEPASLETRRERPRHVRRDGRTPVLYLAPWVDLGGSDKGTIDWFAHIDRSVWAPSIITTQPSDNRWLRHVEPYAEEVWPLPDLMTGEQFAPFILDFVVSRGVEVVHIMNSRLGFELLADLSTLPDPPRVVVQLHAEEPDRSGYVRFVTTRFDALVDAYSVTSEQLATAMGDFDVDPAKLRVITTGVDAAGAFDPEGVEPYPARDERPRILWPGRLVEQKDPHLTLEVVRRLADRGVPFVLDVVGDGHLLPEIQRRAKDLGLDDWIDWHPPSHDMPRWYRTADVLLMTSVFEGVPYVIYEAQAMGVPVVVPALPGNVELLAGQPGAALVEPRDDVQAYADALATLLLDPVGRRRAGDEARARMLRDCTLERMGAEHDALYAELLGPAGDAAPPPPPPPPPAPVRFPRDRRSAPSVAVIVPCFRHGRYLQDAIDSIRAQTYPVSQIIVVDDCSDDAVTVAALARLEHEPDVLVRRLPVNSGPSVARNRALAEVDAECFLPLDADDTLLPHALEQMVEQLTEAPEDVGYVYPNALHFGNRHDYYEAPAFNAFMLMQSNFCPAACLFDMRIVQHGLRYPEDMRHAHEDWDFLLTLLEHDVRGIVAEGPTFRYRKTGFGRSAFVNVGEEDRYGSTAERHPSLYGRSSAVKARWAPSLSIVLATGVDRSGRVWPPHLAAAFAEQTCTDFELLDIDGLLTGDHGDLAVRTFDETDDFVARVAAALAGAKGHTVAVLGPGAANVAVRPNFVELLLRAGQSGNTSATVLAAGGPAARPGFAALQDAIVPDDPDVVGVAWRRPVPPDAAPMTAEVTDRATLLRALLVACEQVVVPTWRQA